MRVRLTEPQGPFTAGAEVDYDDPSGAHLIESGSAVLVDDGSGFDPGGHTVAEVHDYLEDADDVEADRVLMLERAGKARVGILGDAV